MEPNVEDIIINEIFKFNGFEIKPENARINSDGIGGKRFSNIRRKHIPIYPKS